MKFASLRLRLMVLAVVWVAASLVAAGVLLQVLFVANLERSATEELDAIITRLVALTELDERGLHLADQLPDARYDTPLGGRYWQIELPESGTVLRSRSLWDMTIAPADAGSNSLSHYFSAHGPHIAYITRQVEIGDQTVVISAGEDHGPIHEASTTFAWDLVRLFSLLGVLIVVAAWIQLRLGLAPLSRLRQTIDAVREGRQPRLSGDFASELRPLVDEVNALLDERDANTERARRRAADLAHGLKTPLAALQGIALTVRERGETASADLIDDLAFEMSRRVDYQMRLASLRLRASEHRESASLNGAVIRTLTVLKKTGRGDALHWMAELGSDLEVDIHRQDLMELVGVILENAAKWAATKVVVRTDVKETVVELLIEDDGPGIPDDRLSQLGRRGQRLDESAPGTGLGLAIAAEILELNRGQIAYSRASIGGLAVRITLPLTDR